MSDPIAKMAHDLGFPATFKQITADQDEDEERISLFVGVVGGMLGVLQTHTYAHIDRIALLAETDQLATQMESIGAGPGMKDGHTKMAKAIGAAIREAARSRKGVCEKQWGICMPGEPPTSALQYDTPKLARFMVRATFVNLPDEMVIEAKKTGEPPKRAIDIVVRALRAAYVFQTTPAVVDVLRMHVRAAARLEINDLFAFRGLKLD